MNHIALDAAGAIEILEYFIETMDRTSESLVHRLFENSDSYDVDDGSVTTTV